MNEPGEWSDWSPTARLRHVLREHTVPLKSNTEYGIVLPKHVLQQEHSRYRFMPDMDGKAEWEEKWMDVPLEK